MRAQIGIASNADRDQIYKIRHLVYAEELKQHPSNVERMLLDELDNSNIYIRALDSEGVCGFVAITPPDSSRFSIDKYFSRSTLPILLDSSVFEVRLLTVVPNYRNSSLSYALMFAALNWIEAHGGERIVAIGRKEILNLYQRCGLELLNHSRTIRSGRV